MFINEASKRSGATQRAIRLYESLGLLNVSRSGKYRVYNQQHISLIKIIKEAQTLGIQLSDLVALKSDQEDLDWALVSDFLVQQQKIVEEKIKTLEIQKQRIADYRVSIDQCIRGVDSDL
ncbi:MerR family transcriptional regulator [Vibrio gazogenes]|uniref:DNA-binding transcriptional regulator, MerR family n=1 Tax=Vibrio gazogenes DSM 21264 = NBRC 103151 TaxID=1123492 RepID=A0A1M4UU34_VIBGA|nr:MerR family transcriptional regulator [Vibrio gazogenes]USP15677.1 MerR family transcriptional regulator [Vibrio gazogenes]SHE60188.1 DNA-binding transcriptional regulator, MerR family [Vibrio gazogenes DSM 21264] [Vibrio gazogenes DSM 21264 = NBRC 103151]SJN56143.1 HTH-type transcriptional regulator YfmP [Vibrio gazogenes]